MKTNREFVSRIINDIKALSKDDHISRRYILQKGRDKAKFLMSQKLDEMTLFREDGIISHIDCFPLKNIPTIDCGIVEFKLCKNLMQSVHKIPQGIFGKNGSGILSVTSIDGSMKFDYISPRGFHDISKRRFVINRGRYYTIKNGYIYLTDSEVEMVNISMFALDKSELEKVSECCTKSNCKSLWDYEFICPDRFLDLVARDTLQEVVASNKSIPADTNPNLDNNQKTKTAV